MELKTKVTQDEYTAYVESAFDLSISEFATTSIPELKPSRLPSDWNIGVICGASGSGKSTILRTLGEIKEPTFDDSISVLSNFAPMPPKEASMLLSSMGLASVPAWIRPFSTLSNGEKYRATVAKIVSESDIALIDEYTSVVDRNVAKSMSNALAKYVRRNNKRVILATCHYDILEWLCPDWVFDLNKGGVLERGDYLQRPKVQLQVYRTTSDTWRIFAKHHYMTSEMNESAQCFCFTWNNQLVAFVGVLPQPSGFFEGLAVRGTRTVVLPDFQGLGIGRAATDFIAGIYKAAGYRYYTKTVNPRLGEYREKSPKWTASAKNGKLLRPSASKLNKRQKLRPSYCHQYTGEPIYGEEHLIAPIAKLRQEKSLEGQLSLF